MARGAANRVKSATMETPAGYLVTPHVAPDRASVANGFVTGLLSGARARRIDVRPLLAAAGLPPTVPSEHTGRVPLTAYEALYNAVVERLADEGFGLFRAPVPRGSFEFLCRATVGSRELGQALDH